MRVASFEKLKSDWNQTWFIDTIWDPLNVYAVKGHIPWSKVIRGQVVRWAQNVKFTSFGQLKSDWNQTCCSDIMLKPSHVHEVKGHVRSICKIGQKCQI